ncbi:MAG: hypothetical protein V2I36_19960, partial [Desulfopila sp.]|nr:hypothetical protein [Desulfopila sp.]
MEVFTIFFDSLNFGNFNCRSAGIIIDVDHPAYPAVIPRQLDIVYTQLTPQLSRFEFFRKKIANVLSATNIVRREEE